MSTTTPTARTTTTAKSPAPSPAATPEAATHGSPARDRDIDTTWSQRAVDSVTRFLDRSGLTRRSFLTKTAVVGSALAVDPTGLLLRPQSAWASVCGEANECHQGWSAFCATINNGANECPDGSFTAGWWKIDNSEFCSGAARYIVDCNEIPPQGSKCSRRCANGECDRRRVCWNDFRYGQCNTQVAGTTPVVCRLVLCTPPWQWDDDCTRTTLTDNRTLTHWSAALPSRTNPTPITVRWLEMGLVGSVLGDMVGSERNAPDGGSWARFDDGVMTALPKGKTRVLTGPHARAYADLGGPESELGYPRQQVFSGVPGSVRYQRGRTWKGTDGIMSLWGPVNDAYLNNGGRRGWMGPPDSNMWERGDHWTMARTASGWWVVHSDVEDQSRVLRSINNMPANGRWPDTARVRRWSGRSRYHTAADVATHSYPNGSTTVLVTSGQNWPDAASGGAASGRLGAPIVLVARSEVPQVTMQAINDLGADRAIILGGTASVSSGVASTLRSRGLDVARWSGRNRYATAARISRGAFPDGSNRVVIATGMDFPDALAVAPLAQKLRAPLLLTTRNQLPDTVASEIRRLGAGRATIVGGGAAVATSVADQLRGMGLGVRRIAGPNRMATSARIAARLGGSGGTAMVANGTDFPDALAAASFATRSECPILLARRHEVPHPVDQHLLDRRPDRIIMVGGHAVLGNDTITRALNGYRT